MANPVNALKTAGTIVTAVAAITATLKDNPQLAETAQKAVDKLRSIRRTDAPKERFDAQLAAIEVCASTVEAEFPEAAEVTQWRQAAKALRVRGDLLWAAGPGSGRRAAIKALSRDTQLLLARMDARLTELIPGLSEATAGQPERRRRLSLGRGRDGR